MDTLEHRTLLGAADHSHAPSTLELKQAFRSQQPQGPKHGVLVDPGDRGKVFRRRQALASCGLADRDRMSDLSSYLEVDLGLIFAVDLDFQHGASDDSSIDSIHDIRSAEGRPRTSFAIIEDARVRARKRRLVAAVLLAVAAAFGAVLLFSGGDPTTPGSTAQQADGSAGTSGSAATEEVTVDGVTIYTTNPGDGATTLYSFEPFAPGDPALSQETASHSTTGDFRGCKLLAKRPGRVGKGCALLIAQVQAGDLRLKAGLPQSVYGVCGRPPGPGEIAACGNTFLSERQINASLRELRRALK